MGKSKGFFPRSHGPTTSGFGTWAHIQEYVGGIKEKGHTKNVGARKQGWVYIWHNRQPCGRHHGVYFMGKPRALQHHQKLTFVDLKEVFLAKECHPFHFSRKKLDYLHFKDFFKEKCRSGSKQPLAPSWCKIIVTYRTSNHSLAIEFGRWWSIPMSRENGLCHVCSHNVVETNTHFVLMCPLYNSIMDKFQSPFGIIASRSLKSCFQSYHFADINLYLWRLLHIATPWN